MIHQHPGKSKSNFLYALVPHLFFTSYNRNTPLQTSVPLSQVSVRGVLTFTIRVAGVEVQCKLMRYLGRDITVRECRLGQSNCPAFRRPYLPGRRNLSSKPKRRKQLVPEEKGQQQEMRNRNSLMTRCSVLLPESSWRPRFNSCHKEGVHHLAPHGQPPVTQGLQACA